MRARLRDMIYLYNCYKWGWKMKSHVIEYPYCPNKSKRTICVKVICPEPHYEITTIYLETQLQ